MIINQGQPDIQWNLKGKQRRNCYPFHTGILIEQEIKGSTSFWLGLKLAGVAVSVLFGFLQVLRFLPFPRNMFVGVQVSVRVCACYWDPILHSYPFSTSRERVLELFEPWCRLANQPTFPVLSRTFVVKDASSTEGVAQRTTVVAQCRITLIFLLRAVPCIITV